MTVEFAWELLNIRDGVMKVLDSSQFWQCLRKLDPKSTTPPPPKLKEGEDDITDPLEISTCFNTFFIHITENDLTDDNHPTPSYDKLKAYVDSKIPPDAVYDRPTKVHFFLYKQVNRRNGDHE